jgi:hypothetical protein
MVDLIVARPGISQNEIAAHFGYTASWVSLIITSDAFQSRLAARKDELVDPAIRLEIEAHFKGVIARSLAILEHKLSKSPDTIPDNLALRALDIASRAAGYGAKTDPPPAPVTVPIHLHLENIGGGLVQLLRKERRAIEGESHEVPQEIRPEERREQVALPGPGGSRNGVQPAEPVESQTPVEPVRANGSFGH